MSFLKYANDNNINIIPKTDYMELTQQVFKVVADNMAKSLGPLGSSAIIFDGTISETTKDGYGILKSYRFNNLYKQMVLNLIQRPCKKMNNTVGDGTTTAIVLTDCIFEEYKKHSKEIDGLYRLPREFTNAWDNVVKSIIEHINEYKRPLDIKNGEVYDIAYVTSNGNKEISYTISEVYKETDNPSIHVKISPNNETYMQSIDGFEFPANVISNTYVTNDDLSSTFVDCYVAIFDHTINVDEFRNVIYTLNNHAARENKYLIVLSPFFEKTLCDNGLMPFINYEIKTFNRINMIPCQYIPGALDPNHLLDLAAVLDCKIITTDLVKELSSQFEASSDEFWESKDNPESKWYGYLGKCDNAYISCTDSAVFRISNINDRHKKAIIEAKKELEREIGNSTDEVQNFSLKLATIRNRIARLEMQNYVYYIGTTSELQTRILKDAVDDVVLCLRSASKHGVVPGCQITIYKAAEEIINNTNYTQLERSIAFIIRNAVRSMYIKILNGPNNDGIFKDLATGTDILVKKEEKVEEYLWKVFHIINNRLLMLVGDDNLMDINDDNYKKSEVYKNDLKEIGKQRKENEEDDHFIWRFINFNIAVYIENLLKLSSENLVSYDIELGNFNKGLITSAETDVMVLEAATDLIKILIIGNQCIYIDRDLNSVHEETVKSFNGDN